MGATSPARWQLTQRAWRIGAMSRVNVGWSGAAAAPMCCETAYAVAITVEIDSKCLTATTLARLSNS